MIDESEFIMFVRLALELVKKMPLYDSKFSKKNIYKSSKDSYLVA
jgi:hypothetical protein